MNFSVSNSHVYGLERAVKASGNPMRTVIDTTDPDDKDFLRAYKLGSTVGGQGHDNFLKGILVHVDVCAPLYWWKEAQRYHWFDFVSSESTMHCLLKFDVGAQCVDETDPVILDRMRELIAEYNEIPSDDAHLAEKKNKWRVLVASLPEGFCLAATMTTNYQQLKTMFNQRKNHKLIEWHIFCDWCLTLPDFAKLTGAVR